MIGLEVLFEDEAIIVCHKNAGVATQTSKIGQMDMVSLVANYRRNQKEEPYVGLVHRLDQPVEGIIIFAKNPTVAASLSKQIQERNIVKQYYAVVEGTDVPPNGTLENYLVRDGKANTSQISNKSNPKAKLAKLEYEKLESQGNYTLLRVTLHTGRHHQIRLQLANAGFPIYGDKKYGNTQRQSGYMPLGLCSCRLEFEHPVSGKKQNYTIFPKGKAFEGFTFFNS